MHYFAILISFVLSAVCFTGAQEEPPQYLCYGFLPVQVPADSPLDFQGLFFESGIAGSGGGVTLLNKRPRELQHYVAIMEFLDENGGYLVSSAVYSVAEKDRTIALDVPFRPWLQRNWPGGFMKPIPAESSSREGFNISLSMLTCPTSARVSMVRLKYDDGTEFNYASPHVQLSTTPAEKMEIHDMNGAQKWGPLIATGTLEVDAQGRARIVDLDAAEVFRNWLQKEFSGWKFIPAWAEGKPVSSRLPFIFYLGDTTHDWVPIEVMRRRGVRGPMLVPPTFP
jgi:hypothetical protein